VRYLHGPLVMLLALVYLSGCAIIGAAFLLASW
jgi:hypothetical protein